MGHKSLEKCAIAVIIPDDTLVGHFPVLFNNKAVVIKYVSVSTVTEVESRISRTASGCQDIRFYVLESRIQ